MDLFVVLAALRARWVVFAGLLGVALLVAVMACVMLPRSYRATAALLVSEPVSSNVLPERAAFLQTQADILTSDNVARRVVALLHLSDNAEARAAYAARPRSGSFDDWLVGRWLKPPLVDLRQSSVLRVSVDAPEAAAAAALANAYIRAYFDFTAELRGSNASRVEGVLDARLAALRDDLVQAQSRLVDYQRSHGLVSAEGGADLTEARLADLAAQLSKARELDLEQASRQRQLRDLARPGGALDQLQEVQTDGQVQRLGNELRQGQAKLQELMQKYGSAHPAVQAQTADNELRSAELASQVDKLLAGLDQAAAQARWRTSELQGELASQRSRLLDGKAERGELAMLANKVDNAQRTYDMAMQRFVVDMVASQAFRAEVSLLSAAAVPLDPRSPRRALVLVGGLVAGTLLGLALVAVLEWRDRRVRRPVDLLMLPAGAVVPLLGMTSRWTPPPQSVMARARQLPTLPDQAARA